MSMNTMNSILFVDDDSNILSSLRRNLHVMRDEWEMVFVDDPLEALTSISRRNFDVVVSDMKMPNMDGIELMREVKRRQPESMRIMLSGHLDRTTIMESVGSIHQFIAKPCKPEKLKQTIHRASLLKRVIDNDAIHQLVGGVGDLPTAPAAYRKILACVQDPESSVSEMAAAIGTDVAITAKLLQLVNSGFFGIPRPVASIEQAVSLLDLETIRTLVLSHGMFARFGGSGTGILCSESLWSYSTRCAAVARMIALEQVMSTTAVENAVASALLHDVGKLVVAAGKPKEYSEVLRRAGEQNAFSDEIEFDLLGTTHSEVGAYLMGLWGYPNSVVEAVAFHEKPSQCDARQFGLAGVVHVASRLALSSGERDDADRAFHVDFRYLETAGVIDSWPKWKAGSDNLKIEKRLQ